MRESDDVHPERLALLLALSTFLFVGALRAFLAAVYYDNLVALELGPTALYALLLLAPIVFVIPALRRRPARTMLAAALVLALARALLAPTRGTELHLPLAGIAAASWLVMLGALVPMLRASAIAPAAAGIAIGWALDVAIVWSRDSADPTAELLGLLLIVPAAALVAWLARGVGRELSTTTGAAPPRHAWLAGAALGVWLFLENTLAANPFGAARWNGTLPGATAAASLVGLLVGALLLTRVKTWPRAAIAALHAGAALALLDHALLHTGAFPLFLAILQLTLVVDLALLLPRLAPRALVATGLVALVLHFLYAFTFLFAFVPLGALWEGRAPALYLLAGLAIVALAALARPAWTAIPRSGRRPFTSLLVVPALVGALAAASSGSSVPAASDDGTIRVLSFNVHQGFSNAGIVDASVFVPVLDEVDADIVVLQEADTPRFTSGNLDVGTYLAKRAGYHHVYGQPTREQAFGGAILSRHPVEEWRAYKLPSTSDNRFFTEARIDVGGTDVWVYAVHFALPHAGRVAQADALLAQAATRAGPKILAGDFNSCPSGLCAGYEENVSDNVYAQITASYQDAWVAAGHDAEDPAGLTYEVGNPHERIDHVFASAEWRVLSAEVVRTPSALAASDHFPVLAVVALP